MDDLRKAQDQIVLRDKLAALGQLTAGVAHEIKNPLNFVKNFSEVSEELLEELGEILTDNQEKLSKDDRELVSRRFPAISPAISRASATTATARQPGDTRHAVDGTRFG